MKVKKVEKFVNEYKNKKYNLLQISGDEFELTEVINIIKKDFDNNNIEIFFKDESEEIIDNLNMRTLFGEKLIIIYSVDTLPKSEFKKVKEIIKIPERIKPNIVLLTYDNNKNISNIENSLIGMFKPVYDSDIPSWTKRYINNLGYIITEEALNYLYFSFGTNREELRKQIEQIILGMEESEKKIEIKHVKGIGFYRDDTIFRITNSIIKGNYKSAIQYLMECTDKQRLFYFINRDIRYLLVIKANIEYDGDVSKLGSKGRLNLHDYFINNLYKPQALKLTFEDLEKNYVDIMESEYKIKRGWDEFSINLNYISQLEVGGQ